MIPNNHTTTKPLTLLTVALALTAVMGMGTVDAVPRWSPDIQLTRVGGDSSIWTNNPTYVVDRNKNVHILFTRSATGILDDYYIHYMLITRTGEILRHQAISDSNDWRGIWGILGPSGNVHFFWRDARRGSWIYRYMRVSPEGEILDGPREIWRPEAFFSAIEPFHNSDGDVMLSRIVVPNLHFYNLSEDGEMTFAFMAEDTAVYYQTQAYCVSDDDVYYMINDLHDAEILTCTAFDLRSREYIYQNIEWARTNGRLSADAAGVSTRHNTLYVAWGLSAGGVGGTNRLHGMDRNNNEPIFDYEILDYGTGTIAAMSDLNGRFHYAIKFDNCLSRRGHWVPDSSRDRFYIEYGIVNHTGDYVYGPELITYAEVPGSDYFYNLWVKDEDTTAMVFVRGMSFRAPRIVTELIYKYSPYDPNAVKERMEGSDKNQSMGFFIFPNPTNGQFRILGEFFQQGVKSLQIHDITGRLVHQLDFTSRYNASELMLELPANLESGVYLLTIQTLSGKTTQKLVLTR